MSDNIREQALRALDRYMPSTEARDIIATALRGMLTEDEVAARGQGLLTIDDLHALSEITDACTHGYRVARLMESGEVLEGVARSIGDERGNFIRRDEDVRDGYLRVSSMFEHFWPIRELIPLVKRSEFVVRRGES